MKCWLAERVICNGVEPASPLTARSPEPLFVALGRLAGSKRLDVLLRLSDRVRPVTGGRLLIVGDGPQRARLQVLAGPGVTFTGRVSEADKHRLLCAAWLLLHPAIIEGWGIVVAEAAVRGTPAIGFRVPGLRDSVLDGQTGGRGPGAVALLPWAAYRRYGWNEGGPDRRPRRWRRGGQRPRSAARPADNLARAPGVVAGSAATARPAEGG
jgi:glycosyltransferase involved in cell wall biosynthesis